MERKKSSEIGPKAALPSCGSSLPVVSAKELHEILLTAHAVGNRARRKFIRALYAMAESRLFLRLGFSSIVHYAERCFKYQRSQIYDFLNAAKALEELRRCDEAFQAGELSWSVLREIVKVATPESEEKWIEFARERSVAQVKAEVKDALAKKRTEPRENGYGLPSLPVRLTFELAPEEYDIVSKALRKAADELASSLGAQERVEPKEALLYMSRELLATDPEGERSRNRTERDESLYTILYHQCPDCRRAFLPTDEGPVEIPREVVERVAPDADKVVIRPEEENRKERSVPKEKRDKPNTTTIIRKVRLRDGRTCSNPLCRRRLGLHAHHVTFRKNGGRTSLANEVLLCSTCHAAVHLGFLSIEGDPVTGLRWKPRVNQFEFELTSELKDLSEVAEVRTVEVTGPQEAGESTRVDKFSTHVDSGPDPALVEALVGLGYPKKEAQDRIERAWNDLCAHEADPAEGELLALAIREG